LPRPSGPHGIARPFEASTELPSRYSVRGSRLVVSTTSRHSRVPLSGAEAPEAPMDFSFPSGRTETSPPEPESSGNPHGVLRLYSDMGVKVHGPGLPHPVRSAFRVSHPLDGLLPSRFPASRTGATHEVHPTERFPSAEPHAFRRRCPLAVSGIACPCSEDQEFTMPRSSRALLPAEIRTRGRPKSARADTLMGLHTPLQSVPLGPWRRLPGTFPPALPSSDLREIGTAALQGFVASAGRATPRGAARLS
jgi:hypothetical protein